VEVQFELPGESLPGVGDAQAVSLIGPYEKAARDNPGDNRAWRNLGVAYLKAGQPALGIQCLEQALRLDPADQALKKWLDVYKLKHPAKP
jgi:tetratricopeptide (TPR) repeat protein